jgi:hypothetical protein
MDQKLDYRLDAAQNRTEVREDVAGSQTAHAYDLETPASGFSSNRYATAHGATHVYDRRGNLTFDGRFFYVYNS